MKLLRNFSRLIGFLVILNSVALLGNKTFAQMRQVFVDNVAGNEISKLSFYSPAQGYVAFRDWIGYTADSGRTFTKKLITNNNVNFNGNSVNILFGFSINGIKAFDQNTIIAYGDYGLVPAILYSTDGGTTYSLVYHSQFNSLNLSTGITDMVFPGNNNIGYAVDADRILKTTDRGLTWVAIRTDPNSCFDHLEAIDNNNVYAISDYYIGDISFPGGRVFTNNKILSTANAGTSWQPLSLPAGYVKSASFINASRGWVHVDDNLFFTANKGISWSQKSRPETGSFNARKFKFINDSTGYALYELFEIVKTTDSGKIWERLPRNNNYTYLGYSHNDLQLFSGTQLWAAGGHGFLEISTNAGGTRLPSAYIGIDTSGLSVTGKVNLVNYSRSIYSYSWLLNGVLISTDYNASYLHNINRTRDTISLIVSNGTHRDTSVSYQYFFPPVTISSFTPVAAGSGNLVTITGTNFSGATSVSFGGVPASGFRVLSNTSITATVGGGSSGEVKVVTATGQGSLAGFTYSPPPTVSSFAPTAIKAGNSVTITGTNFIAVSAVSFGGVPATAFNVISPTTINAVVPSGPSGSVSVTTAGGVASLAGYISLPTIASFTPSGGTQGTVLNISGTSLSDITSITIGGINALSFIVNSSTSITATIGSGRSGNVTVTKTGGSATLAGFTWFPSPVITSFSPAAGPAGTTVTIAGTGFNAVAGNNTVYFGAVKAVVTSGSATSLTVTVPVGATFEPISVTNNKLIAYSAQPYLLTFPNGGSITANSFANSTVISTAPDNYPRNICLGDLDTDGKPDMIVSQNASNAANSGVLLYRNTSTAGAATFANPVNIGGLDFIAAATGDLDGDGKLDLAIISDNKIATFKNTSVPGNISFIANTIVQGVDPFNSVCLADVDGDGKADIIGSSSLKTYVFRNVSEPGIIVFAAGSAVFAAGAVRNTIIADLDGDKKPEIIVAGTTILRNISTPGIIDFVSTPAIPGFNFSYITAGDLDADGKTDLVTGDYSGSRIGIYRNLSTLGNISFAAMELVNATANPTGVALSDMDGDGKLDMAACLSNYSLAVFKNLSTPGNFLFAPLAAFTPGAGMLLALGDMNADGRNDAIVIPESGQRILLYVNNVRAEPFIQSFTPTLVNTGSSVTITGGNFIGVTGVSFGGVPAASFIVNNASTITAVVGDGASGTVSVTNNLGTGELAGLIHGAPPVITSFSPLSAPAGASITISGKNFSSTTTNNIVSFGGVMARVTSATATTLSVIVPFGSIHAPVSVTTGSLTAYSAGQFVTSFRGAGGLNTSSFAPRIVISNRGGTGCLSDIDGDGKLDMVATTNLSTLTVSKNTSTSGNISFAPGLGFPVATKPGQSITGDLDGDGKPDLAVISGDATISVLRNTSTQGNISFAVKTDYITGYSATDPVELNLADLDGDGKAEIVVANYSSGTLTVFKNTSTLGNISFAPRTDYAFDRYGGGIKLNDLDGDGKPEMIATNSSAVGFSVFPNISKPGTIAFAPVISFGTSPGIITVGDLDNDGKADIAHLSSGIISLFRNISVTGSIAFSAKLEFTSGTTSQLTGIYNNDLDGDGKTDIYITQRSENILSILKNNSTPGNLALSANIAFNTIDNTNAGISGDIDADGKADIITFHLGGITSIYRNQVGGNGPGILSFSPISAFTDSTVTISGSNFTGSTQVSFDGVPAASFTVVSDNMITAVVGAGASGNITVTTPRGTGSLGGFIFGVLPVITNVSPMLALAGTSITINGANFTGATAVSFGEIAADSFVVNSSTSITAKISSSGASGNVTVTTAGATASLPGFLFVVPPMLTSFSPVYAGGGATVTITGTNFTGATAVSFGGIPAASFTIVSPDIITAVVSNATMSGSVSVVTPGGQASQPGFTYSGSPGITSFYPIEATIGTPVIITGVNLTNVTAVKFGGTPATSFTVTSPTTITAIVDTGSSGAVSVANANGFKSLNGFTFIPATTPAITTFTPAIAATGSVVIITGMNFTGTTAVSFGGVAAASFTINSPTNITAIVGTGSSGEVSVTTAGGSAKLPGFTHTNGPVIYSFSPRTASPGSTVTITGANFATIASSNIVYFGTVKATVVSGTATTLSVSVPAGATYQSISVTASGLTAYSSGKFLPAFTASGILNSTTFATRLDSSVENTAGRLSLSDIDSDGKPDISIATGSKSANSNLTFFRNTGSAGNLAFASKFIIADYYLPNNICHTDFNGDGKLDIVTSYAGDVNACSVYENTSSPSLISYSTGTLLTAALGPFDVNTHDFDGDGKPDIALFGYYTGFSVYRNISTAAGISFAPRLYLGAPNSYSFEITDIDLDGKPDVIITAVGKISFMRNTSTVGNLSFTLTTIPAIVSGNYDKFTTGDFDGDGKMDIAVTTSSIKTVSIFKNTSVPGYIAFDPKIDIATASVPYDIVAGDLDGNGKPDIIVSSTSENFISVFTNSTVGGSIAFEPAIDYATSCSNNYIAVGDIDGDGKPEITLSNPLSNSISILKNQLEGNVTLVSLCTGTGDTLTSDITGTSYQWQQNTSGGFANISDNENFTGTSTASLQLINIPFAFNNYEYRCIVSGTKISGVFKLTVAASVIPTVNITATTTTICAGANVTFTATAVNGGTNPLYQWKKNGINTGTNSNTYNSNTLVNGDIITATLTGNATCANPTNVTSAGITIIVNSSAVAIEISGATTTIPGTNTMLTSVVTNAGTAPTFQWQDSTNTHDWLNVTGAVSPTVNYLPTMTGDKLRCILTPNSDCATGVTVTSNTLIFTLDSSGLGGGKINVFPNPVSTYLTIDSLSLDDAWQTVAVRNISSAQNIMIQNIVGQTRIVSNVASLPAGIYVGVLINKDGKTYNFTFVKV